MRTGTGELEEGGCRAGSLRLAARTVRFARVAHAGVNGEPPADGTSCPSGCEPPEHPLARPAIRCVPNPATLAANLILDLPRAGRMRVRICDPAGRVLRELREGYAASGRLSVDWNGRDDAGRELPSGLYFVRVETPGGGARAPLLWIR